MKKTISINISGIIFNIEEDAYEKLRSYLDTISGYFTDSDGREEIMADIEARIAELFQERLSEIKMVVGMQDVEEVIDVMGRPEEYIAEDQETSQDSRKRTGKRRIYRDVDKNVIGGVSAGISHYFGWGSIWLRLIWAICLLFGFGFLIYIILWIIIPPATSTAERLEMMGEDVNVETIKKKVDESIQRLKGVTDIDDEFQLNYAKGQVGKGADLFVNILRKLVKFIGIVIGFLFLILGFALISFIIYSIADGSIFAFHGNTLEWGRSELERGLFTSSTQGWAFYIASAFVILIPVLALIMLGVRLLFRIQMKNRAVIPTMFTLWILGIITLAIAAIGLGKEFNTDQMSSERHTLNLVSDTLYIGVADDPYFGSNLIYKRGHHDASDFLQIDNDSIYCGHVELKIVQNVGSETFELEVDRTSRGYNNQAALQRAENIQYSFVQNDDLLRLNPYFSYDLDDKFRAQECELILKVPKGKTIYLGENLPRVLDRADNRHNVRVRDMVNKHWTMTDDGLQSSDSTDPEEMEAI